MAGITRVAAKTISVKSLFESLFKATSPSLQTTSRNVQTTSDHGQQSALKEESEGKVQCYNGFREYLGWVTVG